MGKEIAVEKVSFAATKGSNNAVFTGNTKTLAILDKFERQEKLGGEKKQKVKENRAVRGMRRAFEETLKKWTATYDGIYEAACVQIEKCEIVHTAEDIRLFSTTLARFQYNEGFAERAGVFLSALMNRSNEKEFAIDTENLAVRISYLGYKNTKKITVNGDAGDLTGLHMEGGKIIVRGNNGFGAGCKMTCGEIVVHGDSGSHLGNEMGGGKITVHGNAGEWAGVWMHDGIIMVDGDAGDDAGYEMHGGRMTVKGNVGRRAGVGMHSGCIVVKGDAGEGVGSQMSDGKVAVNGRIESLSGTMSGGNIFQRGRQLVKDGEIIGEIDNK